VNGLVENLGCASAQADGLGACDLGNFDFGKDFSPGVAPIGEEGIDVDVDSLVSVERGDC
jgi:hypothetical protein